VSHEDCPERWYSTNLVGIPAPVLASTTFNAHPVPLHVAGAREANHGLFALLVRSADMAEARFVFEHYMSLAFGLARPEAEDVPPAARRWRAS